MKHLLVAALFALAHATAFAQSAPAPDALFQEFGGKDGLVKLMDDFVARVNADVQLKPFFKDTNLTHLKKQLVDQLCEVSGGPCKFDGPSMKDVHADFEIRKGDFNRLVEVLQLSMDAQGIAFGAQNRMLARLAPMHRDIINTP